MSTSPVFGRGRGWGRGKLQSAAPLSVGRGRRVTTIAQSGPAQHSSPHIADTSTTVEEDQFADIDPEIAKKSSVVAEVSDVSTDIGAEEVKGYFEAITGDCDDAEVSVVNLGGGKFRAEIIGLSAEEIEKLTERKKHKIKRQAVRVEFPSAESIESSSLANTQPFLLELTNDGGLETRIESPFTATQDLSHQPHSSEVNGSEASPLVTMMKADKPPELISSDEADSSPLTVLEVSHLPHTASAEMIELYFETAKSGGCTDCVNECQIVAEGVAHVTFTNSKVAAQVVAKSHALRGNPITVQYLQPDSDEPSAKPSTAFFPNKLHISDIPEGVSLDHLTLFIERTTGKDDSEFTIEMENDSAIVTFNSDLSDEEFAEITEAIETKSLKKKSVRVQRCLVPHSIHVSCISKHDDEEYIEMYFENSKRSGGGAVESVQMLGNGEAIITFKDPEVIKNVVEKPHTKAFGEAVVVKKHSLLSRATSCTDTPVAGAMSPTQPPDQILEIKISNPLVAKCIKRHPQGLNKCVQTWSVQISINDREGCIQACPTGAMKPGWQEECSKQIHLYIDSNFKEIQHLPFPKEAATDVCRQMQAIQEEAMFTFELPPDQDNTLNAVGDPNMISTVLQKIEDICSAYIQEEKKISLSPEDHSFISQVKSQEIADSHPTVVVTFNTADSNIVLQGSQRDVNHLLQCIPEYADHGAINVVLDPLIIQCLYVSGRQQLQELLQAKQCHIAVYFSQISHNRLELKFLCSLSNKPATKSIANEVASATGIYSFSISCPISEKLSQMAEYQQLCRELQHTEHVLIVTTPEAIAIAGFQKCVNRSKKKVEDYIKEACSVTIVVHFERGMWRLFNGSMKSHWNEKVITKAKESEVQIRCSAEGSATPVIELKGESEAVEIVRQEIKKLTKSVATKSIECSRPGICRYFSESDGMLQIKGVEKQEEVCIELSPIDTAETNETLDVMLAQPSYKKICMAQTKKYKQIIVYEGDITEFDKADVIVNAANEDLEHYGGVAKAIANKGGSIIQEECRKHVKKSGKLSAGECWMTTAVGKLPYKAIIHAVGPKWESGGSKQKALLTKACRTSLNKASMRYQSIAFPAISSGIYGFPIDVCAEALIRAVVDFSSTSPLSTLNEINFVVFSHRDGQAFASAIKAQFPDSMFEGISAPSPLLPSTSIPATKSRKKKPVTMAPVSVPDCIKLHRGSIMDFTAEVYVNTTNENLDLSQGQVSKALAAQAGPSLQTECNQKAPVKVGSVTTTSAGNLRCQYIFHTVLPGYSKTGGQPEKVLRSAVRKCMEECVKLGVSSIAFPALGTGGLRYPSAVVAKIMIDEISSFILNRKAISLSAVHLVIFMPDSHTAFQQELAKMRSQGSASSSLPMGSATANPKPGRRRSKAPKHTPIDSSPTHAHSSASTSGDFTFTIEGLKVFITCDDITKDDSDVIVNSTNSHMQLEGPGVSGALLKKGGPQLQAQCDLLTSQGLKLEEGKVRCTIATGNLKCKSVFHIVFESNDTHRFVKLIVACLQQAEKLMYKSIAFPAIGTGVRGYPSEEVAKGMIQAIRQFVTFKPQHITKIKLVLFQHQVHQAFIRMFQNPEEAEQHGLFQRAKNFLGSFFGSANDGDEEDIQSGPLTYDVTMCRDLELKIYGPTEKSVECAEKIVSGIIEKQFVSERIYDPNICKLSRSKLLKLKQRSSELHIDMDCDQDPALSCITIKGDRVDVSTMKHYIHQELAAFEKQMTRRQAAEDMKRIIQWKRVDSKEEEEDYDTDENYEIELAYRSISSEKGAAAKFKYQTETEHYSIDFKKMQETDHKYGAQSKVHRVDFEKVYQEGEKPANWDPMPVDRNGKEHVVCAVDLPPHSQEYQDVESKINVTMATVPTQVPSTASASMSAALAQQPAAISFITRTRGLVPQPPSVSSSWQIISIQRIQNPTLYGQYVARKKQMDKQNPQGHQNERRLFHGTKGEICSKINPQGFNRSFAGANATVYGKGVYFARDAEYSARDTYSPRDANGYKYMYLARVLTGEYARGGSSMLVPPAKQGDVLYDSVVDSTQNPGIFVIFQDSQAYPEYLITFQ